ncbi:xaa-Pro aminopeptidase 3-like [Dendronephthya gigantea]|uniref:xaa-Pro aminopeptidase 3-like n=1 Tax=Dendronephthya gigantea TaxID=151771 RepID=UPI00106D679A|nr:xaa-Pro aminopeptidase 3-like [Dendronephthya gigantea]
MVGRYMKVFQICRYGISGSSVCWRKLHTSKVTHLLGQPTGVTHPHLMQNNEITPGISRDEYVQRRDNLIKVLRNTHYGKLHKRHILIFTSSPEYFMGPDVPYPFRQNSNFLYLTGYQEPDSVLIVEIGGHTSPGQEYKTVFFTRPRDPSREIWDGPRSGIEGAVEQFGFHEAYSINDLSRTILERFNDENCHIWYDHMEPSHLHINKDITDVLFNTAKYKFSRIHRVGHLVESLRVVKSPAEISLLKKCTSITAKGFIKTMANTKAGIQESQLQNIMEFECKKHGADRLSFPPVVATGSMANILHYISNNQILRDGELLLVDSGCEYNGYSSDTTRVWPVNGKFTKAQKELYEMMLNIQKECIKLCQVGTSIDNLYQAMTSMMENDFEALKLIPKGLQRHQNQQLVRKLCPHHIGHHLGMDVHDISSVGKNLPLSEGMVITIEPGLYVRDELDVPKRYKGIGIRIEDDILITKTGPVVLTSECPKEVDQLENIVGSCKTI